jgi:hypothetical protein
MTQTINPVKNPSAETNATGYYTLPGTTGVAALTNPVDGGAPGAGTDYVRSTWSTASTAAGGGMQIGHPTNTGVERIDLVASTQYSAGVWVRASKAKTLALQALAFNTSGAQVGATAQGTAVAVSANTWTRITVPFTTGVGAVRGQLRVVDTDATRWLVSDKLDVDAVMVWPGSTLPAYSDPSTNGWMAWQGTAHASVSILFTPVLVITPYLDENPSPRVEVFVQDPPPGTVTVARTADRRTMTVSGMISVPTGSGVTRLDLEVPFGVPVSYTAQFVTPTGAPLGYVSTTTPVTLAVTDTWISQPLNPRLAVKVDLTDESATELKRGFVGDKVYTQGATVARWIGGRRHGLEDLKLVAETATTAAADMLQDIFGTYDVDQVPVVCIRTPPTYLRIPRTLFLAVPAPTETDINRRYGGSLTLMNLVGDEALRPAAGLVAALLRYADTDAFYGSYAAIDSAYGSYLARDRDYSKAGYAG